MNIRVIVDNIGSETAPGEWGLCLAIEHEGHHLLLDTGNSSLFADNMAALGGDLAQIEACILSHAHHDHAGGLETFFRHNAEAKVYLQRCCGEGCYLKIGPVRRYVGIPKGILEAYAPRFSAVSGRTTLWEGAYLLPHQPQREPKGKAQHLYLMRNGHLMPDDFAHEQSLILRTAQGLVIVNSCSHIGGDAIIREVQAAFPGEPICAYVGGLHLVGRSSGDIRALAQRMCATGIRHIYTGHCTKSRGYRILQQELGNAVEQFRVGMEIRL